MSLLPPSCRKHCLDTAEGEIFITRHHNHNASLFWLRKYCIFCQSGETRESYLFEFVNGTLRVHLERVQRSRAHDPGHLKGEPHGENTTISALTTKAEMTPRWQMPTSSIAKATKSSPNDRESKSPTLPAIIAARFHPITASVPPVAPPLACIRCCCCLPFTSLPFFSPDGLADLSRP